MKINSKTKKAIGILVVLLSMGYLKAQNAVPNAFPVGDEKAKQEWIKANPDAYRSLGGQLQDTDGQKKKVATTEVASTPEAVKIAASPQPWGANENKAAWIAAHPAQYAQLANQPVDAPSVVVEPLNETRIRISRDEFTALPADKQASVLSGNFLIVDKPTSGK